MSDTAQMPVVEGLTFGVRWRRTESAPGDLTCGEENKMTLGPGGGIGLALDCADPILHGQDMGKLSTAPKVALTTGAIE